VGVAAVLLAAGESRRLGRPKQLLPHGGQPLLRVLATEIVSSQCESTAVVLSGRDPAVRACLEGLPVAILVNAESAEGMASSIRRGVAWASRERADGVLLMVCDQPALTREHVDRLLDARSAGTRIVASRYEGGLGVPALFSREMFGALLALRGDMGARKLIQAEEGVLAVDWPAGAVDIDTPEDAAALPGGTHRG
jgi:CTP:molybdopterin cytidylyltransferase MocA